VRSSLGEQIAVQLYSMISKGIWTAGQQLPSELELCRSLQVGRSTLREAMKSLCFVGVVEVHPGEGTFVARGPSKFLERIITQGILRSANDLKDLLEARLALEPELAALCAPRVTNQELSNLDSLMKQMERALPDDRTHFAELDLRFHLAIATGSRNRALSGCLSAIREPLNELIKKGALSAGGCEEAHTQHQKIIEAIKQRRPAKARNAMRAHLRFFQRGYLVLSRVSASALDTRHNSASVNGDEA
jgi:GntR family transcriptional repressor for pyruvate dehydrogenase complex